MGIRRGTLRAFCDLTAVHWLRSDRHAPCVADVPELPGCAADGPTYQEAIANVEVVIDEWIETAKELGRSVPQLRDRLLYA